jgi:flagellar basal-body rod protein FlgB
MRPRSSAKILAIRHNPDALVTRWNETDQPLGNGLRRASHQCMSLNQAGLELGHFLSYLSQRQQVIASNIANADTPGFKTRDVEMPLDFRTTLNSAVIEASGLESHNDGNNVSMDREARLLSENSLKFTLATQMLKGELKGIRSAIEEGRSA